MKAEDYFEKYKIRMMQLFSFDHDNSTPEQRRSAVKDTEEAVTECIVEMMNEIDTIRIQRRAMTVKSNISIAKEMNARWNKMCRLFEKEYGVCPVKYDCISDHYRKMHPLENQCWS